VPQLVLSRSPYRSFVGHLLRRVEEIKAQSPGRPLLVVIPALARQHWWDYLLTTGRAERLRAALLRHGGPNLAVVTVPWAREAPRPEKIIGEEEPPTGAVRRSLGAEPVAQSREGPRTAGMRAYFGR
jgi:hypothetical protein